MVEIGPWLDPIVPQPEECVASIAIRLAPRGLVTVGELLRLGLGLRSTELAMLPERDEALQRLSVIGSFDVEDLRSRCWRRTDRGYTVLQREVPHDWVAADRRRVAPGMLAQAGEQASIPVLWQLRALPCDPDSGEVLIDRCECGEHLWWSDAETLWGCQKCGADVRDRAPILAPPEIVESVREFWGYFQTQSASDLPEPFNTLPQSAVFSAMNWFGYAVDFNRYLRPAAPNALIGYKAVMRWPNSFDDTISAAESGYQNRQTFMTDFISCIARSGNPTLELILRNRAAEYLGVPANKATHRESRGANWLLRYPYPSHGSRYAPVSIPAKEFATKSRPWSFKR